MFTVARLLPHSDSISERFVMATQNGTNWQQYEARHTVQNAVNTFSIHPSNRDIIARAAITLHSPTKRNHWAETGIWKIVSDGDEQVFEPGRQSIKRNHVTKITFRTISTQNTLVRSCFIVDYWT